MSFESDLENFDLTDAKTQNERVVIHAGNYTLEIAIKRGGLGPRELLRLAKDMSSLMPEINLTVAKGPTRAKAFGFFKL